MKTVLLVGHGSRVPAGNEELLRFTGQLAARRPELKIETCFIELASPSILGGIAKCVEDGATQIYIVPIILFAAGHSKLDIPMAIDEAKRRYPEVEFIYGRPLGVQPRAVELLLDRISEAEQVSLPAGHKNEAGIQASEVKAVCTSAVADGDTAVLLMGRGGSDPDANSDFYKLGRLLWERTGYRTVECCFIAVSKPSLPDGLNRCLTLGARRIIVLPYLLFTGVLMEQFAETVARFAAEHPGIEVEMGGPLGAHPLMLDMLNDRIEETLEGQAFSNCDNCRFRDEASLHHHHHHHHGEGHEHHGHEHGHYEHEHGHHEHACHGEHGHGCHSHHGHECHGHHGRHDVTETAAAAEGQELPVRR